MPWPFKTIENGISVVLASSLSGLMCHMSPLDLTDIQSALPGTCIGQRNQKGQRSNLTSSGISKPFLLLLAPSSPSPISNKTTFSIKLLFMPGEDLVASSYTFFINFGSEAASASLGPSMYTGIVRVSLNLLLLVCFCDILLTHSRMSLVFSNLEK